MTQTPPPRRWRLAWRLYTAFAGACFVLIAALLWQLHSLSVADYRAPGGGPDVQAQLDWLGARLRAGGGEETQAWYPEGYFFTHAIYGIALVNQVLLNPDDDALRARNVAEIEWALARLESDQGRAPFPRRQAVPYGVFYLGWSNRLLGGLLLIQPEADRDPARVAQFQAQSATLAAAFEQSPTRYLEAYPGGCWPVDNVVALSSLKLYDELYGDEYVRVIDDWLAVTRAHLDPQTGLLPHRIDVRTGKIREGARASSLVMALSFLPELDAAFAREQYTRFRAAYAQPVLGFVLMREYPHGTEGSGDVDSGPLVFGLSPVSTGVGLVTARANGDDEVFERVLQLGETLGLPVTWNGQKRYALGQLVAGDAFEVWGKTILPWRPGARVPPPGDYPRLTPRIHICAYGIALALGALLVLPFAIGRRRRTRPP